MSIRKGHSKKGKKRGTKTSKRAVKASPIPKNITFEGTTFTIYQSPEGKILVDPEDIDIFNRYILSKKKFGVTTSSNTEKNKNIFMAEITIDERNNLTLPINIKAGSHLTFEPDIEGSASVPKHMRPGVIAKFRELFPQYKNRGIIWDIEGNQSIMRILDEGMTADQYRKNMLKQFIPEQPSISNDDG